MKISLGPIPYHWDSARIKQFYREVADLPLDIVYLGETVCAKRRPLHWDDWCQIAEQLTVAGKETVFSTLALSEAESELAALERITGNGRWRVEANDMAAVHLLTHTSFIIGPHINIYNDKALTFLYELGGSRWVVPVEIGQHQLEHIFRQRPAGMQTEVIAFGRLPLAFSARCFSARAHDRGKDECGFICGDYPDGMPLNTRNGDPFLLINGIQIQSARTHNLLCHLDELQETGVDIIRILPQADATREIIFAFRQVLEGTITPQQGMQQLALIRSAGFSDGYWRQQAGMEWREIKEAEKLR